GRTFRSLSVWRCTTDIDGRRTTSVMRDRRLSTARTDHGPKRAGLAGWIRTPFGGRASSVVVLTVLLALVAGIAVVSQITGQMRSEADTRLDAFAGNVAMTLESSMEDASSDIRLARQNSTF